MPDFFSRLWQACEQLAAVPEAQRFTLQPLPSRSIDFHLAPSWPGETIRQSLFTVSGGPASEKWRVYALSLPIGETLAALSPLARDVHGRLQLHGLRGVEAWYDAANRMLRVYDFAQGRAVFAAPVDYRVPEWDLHCPFREFFHLWTLAQGGLLVHSGTIAVGGRALLLPGAGGSGKSTTVLSCLAQGMQTTGDDYNLLYESGGEWRAAPLYANFKLKRTPGDEAFRIAPSGWPGENLPYAPKTLYRPGRDSSVWAHWHPQLCGILCPSVPVESPARPTLCHLNAGETVRRLAVSSILQSPARAQEFLSRAAKLATALPASELVLSRSPLANASALASLLTRQTVAA